MDENNGFEKKINDFISTACLIVIGIVAIPLAYAVIAVAASILWPIFCVVGTLALIKYLRS